MVDDLYIDDWQVDLMKNNVLAIHRIDDMQHFFVLHPRAVNPHIICHNATIAARLLHRALNIDSFSDVRMSGRITYSDDYPEDLVLDIVIDNINIVVNSELFTVPDSL